VAEEVSGRSDRSGRVQNQVSLFGIFGGKSDNWTYLCGYFSFLPILVAAPSKAWVFGRSLAEIAASNPAGAWMSVFLSVVCCQI
jgi:hypothetical protein